MTPASQRDIRRASALPTAGGRENGVSYERSSGDSPSSLFHISLTCSVPNNDPPCLKRQSDISYHAGTLDFFVIGVFMRFLRSPCRDGYRDVCVRQQVTQARPSGAGGCPAGSHLETVFQGLLPSLHTADRLVPVPLHERGLVHPAGVPRWLTSRRSRSPFTAAS